MILFRHINIRENGNTCRIDNFRNHIKTYSKWTLLLAFTKDSPPRRLDNIYEIHYPCVFPT